MCSQYTFPFPSDLGGNISLATRIIPLFLPKRVHSFKCVTPSIMFISCWECQLPDPNIVTKIELGDRKVRTVYSKIGESVITRATMYRGLHVICLCSAATWDVRVRKVYIGVDYIMLDNSAKIAEWWLGSRKAAKKNRSQCRHESRHSTLVKCVIVCSSFG